MTVGDRIADEALEWCRTPVIWQASKKGVGADCKGLIWGIARELDRPEAQSLYAAMVDYGPRFDGALLKEGISKTFLPRKGKMQRGDLLLCKFNGQPGHLAIYTGNDRAVHAQISSKAWVKETSLRALFHYFPLDSVWRWRSR